MSKSSSPAGPDMVLAPCLDSGTKIGKIKEILGNRTKRDRNWPRWLPRFWPWGWTKSRHYNGRHPFKKCVVRRPEKYPIWLNFSAYKFQNLTRWDTFPASLWMEKLPIWLSFSAYAIESLTRWDTCPSRLWLEQDFDFGMPDPHPMDFTRCLHKSDRTCVAYPAKT